jgi:uncharacterized membrane protein YdfJ with MMPL/SSD domain
MTTLVPPASANAPSPTAARGALVRLVRAAAHAAQHRPKTIIASWLLLVVACIAAGAFAGTKSLTDVQAEVGQSARADTLLQHARLQQPASESILITGPSAATVRAAATDLTTQATALAQVASATGPDQSPELVADGGRIALVQVQLRGGPDNADAQVAPLLALDQRIQQAHPGTVVQEAGAGSESKAINDMVATDLSHAELISLPITLVILVLAFGALVAASVPLILGITAVAGALGALGLVSHFAPNSQSTSAVVVLIGLAVGVDYSLFYVRREREERRRGNGPARRSGRAMPHSALEAAASSVGRAILISGLTVMAALAGLLLTGSGDFVSIGLGTIVVVAIAVLGSLTVLPAVLALLGDRVDRGRVPGHRAFTAVRSRRQLRAGRPTGAWAGVARGVTNHPRNSLIVAAGVLAAFAIPMLGMHTNDLQGADLPRNLPVVQAISAIDASFPGAPQDAVLVVTGHDLATPDAHAGLIALGTRAAAVTGGRGDVTVSVSSAGTVARVGVPMPDSGRAAARATVERLRDQVAPTATTIGGVTSTALVTGEVASSVDYSDRMSGVTPEVIGFVLALGFLLLLATFRAPWLAAMVMVLNLLSVGASYGILTLVFQHAWAEHLLGFHSTGYIINWLPLFMFVVLFGLSMDYTVLVLERIREARLRGLRARAAAAEGVAATAGTVTSAAIVMVAVFSIFATLGLITFKQLGVGLAAAVLLDATLVRGVALPAVVALLGERGWPIRGCKDASVTPAQLATAGARIEQV